MDRLFDLRIYFEGYGDAQVDWDNVGVVVVGLGVDAVVFGASVAASFVVAVRTAYLHLPVIGAASRAAVESAFFGCH